jgi:hypothetical protein
VTEVIIETGITPALDTIGASGSNDEANRSSEGSALGSTESE